MKKILGLDIGTNSVGWAVVNTNQEGEPSQIEKLGSRIIPMSQDILDKFGQGQTVSSTASRTDYRGTRRLRERSLLRRERLHRVLHILDFLPKHYADSIGWDPRNSKTYGKFLPGTEVKLAWVPTADGHQFLFYSTYLEMLEDLKQTQAQLFETSQTPVPLDWTIYYLRKKALTQPITKHELAWLLLHFNTKRGYYQRRGELEDTPTDKLVEYHALKVVDVEVDPEDQSKKPWYFIHLENGWIYKRQSSEPLDNWKGLVKEFIVTTHLDKEGKPKLDKEGEVRRSFSSPKEDDWTLVKKKTENDLEKSGLTVGAYIYQTLLNKPNQKIRGGLIKHIERNYYVEELEQILKAQQAFLPELQDKHLFEACVKELYPSNDAHRNNLLNKYDLVHLFIHDILFYYRPLKTKKSLISNCPYEPRYYFKDGERQVAADKVIASSNPYFQEFRLWQFIANLKILEREREEGDKISYNVDVTAELLPSVEKKVELFEWLNERAEIKQDQLLSQFFGIKKKRGQKETNYRWNYVEDRAYPCNETRYLLKQILSKHKAEKHLADFEFYMQLWHLLYSIEDQFELQGALEKFISKHQLPMELVELFVQSKPFEKEYGSYSEKAIKKLLPLMRMGKYWQVDALDQRTQKRIQKILDGEVDESISMLAREKLKDLRTWEDFQGLPLWLAGYVVYNRHAESGEVTRWQNPEELQQYINSFKQHSLRNPIVEQVVLETLRTVKDLWAKYGDFDEIHVELGRELKNSAEKRNKITKQQQDNEKLRAEIQEKMLEFYKDKLIDNPYSPSHQLKYRLWMEQNKQSPYTGQTIPLTKLFTPSYQIEHVIPQKVYYDNSLSNKVVCEAEVNSDKGARLGFAYIQSEGGKTLQIDGREVALLSPDQYSEWVKRTYGSSFALKAEKLLAEQIEDVVEDFSSRQLNDTRYINKVVMRLLSNVVRDADEKESTSKHLIPCTGKVTTALKRQWGLNQIWDKLIQDRFERLNELTATQDYGVWKDNRFQIRVPQDLQAGFSKKRIDHRHHAMDALVIACASRSHIHYINNVAGQEDKKKYEDIHYALRSKLCEKKYADKNNYEYVFKKPWEAFTTDAWEALEQLIVSHKQNTRVLTQTTNYTEYINAAGKRELQKQTKGDHYAIRKSLHRDTIYGQVSIRKIKKVNLKKALENWKQIVDRSLKDEIRLWMAEHGEFDAKQVEQYFKAKDYQLQGCSIKKVEVYYYDHDCAAVRKPLDDTFTVKNAESVTDSGIRAILLNHLAKYNNKPKEAFSPEGIADMNRNIQTLNGGKPHHPIYRVRVYEALGSKFSLGSSHNNPKKYAVANKGTNLYFGVYQDEQGKRSFDTIPLEVVIERLKQKKSPVPEQLKKAKLLFSLSPNDLVYVPTEEELKQPELVDIKNLSIAQKKRIYKMVSSTGNRGYFIGARVSQSIYPQYEYGALNKIENLDDKRSIKQVCWKLSLNRLGEITHVIR